MLNIIGPDWLIVVALVLFGLVVGSFLNVVIRRLPVMLERQWRSECQALLAEDGGAGEAIAAEERFDLVTPRSRCPECATPVRAVDNIPVLSWLLLRGRCRGCGKRIGVEYPIVEIASAVLAVVAIWHFGTGWMGLFAIVFSWGLLTAAVIDLHTTLLPDDLTLPLLWLGLVGAALGVTGVTPVDAIIGAAVGYLILWGLFHAFRLLTGKEGMGYGDFKLLAALGAWTGWQGLPVTILLSSVVGAAVGIGLIVALGRDRNIPIPFGPYLAAGGWVALFWGDELTRAYLTSVA
ncbi:prepilin peptidase [Halofilum ochraceum]|uniref:prepilin peptidase n=1 Tax=Halofilum ochraceum TaxID=1611323 RepID=UPI0008D98852|nr:A24 family peptidase [Halofilum ochraceum]